MTLSWDVLATLTPTDYIQLPRSARLELAGFQSAQFRQVEYLLGLKDGGHLQFQDEGSAACARLRAALAEPSLWDEANAALARAGFALPDDVLERDWSQPYQPSEAVEAAWAEVYRDTERIGRSTSSPRSWSTSTTLRHLAAQACRSRSSGSSASSAAPAALPGVALSPVDPRQARLPGALVAEDEALTDVRYVRRS